jgi:hypothetical protein
VVDGPAGKKWSQFDTAIDPCQAFSLGNVIISESPSDLNSSMPSRSPGDQVVQWSLQVASNWQIDCRNRDKKVIQRLR